MIKLFKELDYGEPDWFFIKPGWWWRIKIKQFRCKHQWDRWRKTFQHVLISEVCWSRICPDCNKRQSTTKIPENCLQAKLTTKLVEWWYSDE